jgi:N-acetylmuramoyl-L-alanine amidase
VLYPDDLALPLKPGTSGDAVSDLQARLAALDLLVDDPPGIFGEATRLAVATFQGRRDLAVSGCCDTVTWRSLVEAGYRLGQRLLYRRSPMLRGDDVAELQHRLSLLGFDPGRVDGIFGDETSAALADFQRNVGLPLDGMCGRRTIEELTRVQSVEETTQLVSSLHEQLRLNGTSSAAPLSTFRIGVGEQGGFAAGAATIARALREVAGAGLELHDPDPSHQAQEANAAELDCFISLHLDPERSTCSTAYYRGFRYESLASKHLATLVQNALPGAVGLVDGGISGMALPILRETRMPAIEIQLGSPPAVVQHTTDLARVVVDALASWVTSDHE